MSIGPWETCPTCNGVGAVHLPPLPHFNKPSLTASDPNESNMNETPICGYQIHDPDFELACSLPAGHAGTHVEIRNPEHTNRTQEER